MASLLMSGRVLGVILLLCVGCGPATEAPPRVVPQVQVPAAAEADLSATEICRLIAQRLDLMPGVAQAKWNRQLPITDEKRERALLQKLAAEGMAAGVPAEVVSEFFQAQITAAKLIQEQAFEEWKGAQQAKFSSPPDLEKEVRPRIDALNQQLLKALAKCQTHRTRSDWNAAVERATKSVFPEGKWPEDVVKTAVSPLLAH